MKARYKKVAEKSKKRAKGWRKENAAWHAAQQADYRRRNKDQILAGKYAYVEAHKKKFRAQQRAWTYGTTVQFLKDLEEAQQGRCACCGHKAKLYVDHDHKTGRVRAFLCRHCNTALGMLRESLIQARAMVRYIEKYCRTPKPAQLPLLAER